MSRRRYHSAGLNRLFPGRLETARSASPPAGSAPSPPASPRLGVPLTRSYPGAAARPAWRPSEAPRLPGPPARQQRRGLKGDGCGPGSALCVLINLSDGTAHGTLQSWQVKKITVYMISFFFSDVKIFFCQNSSTTEMAFKKKALRSGWLLVKAER